MEINAFALAERFVGVKEASGASSNAHVLAMLRLDAKWVQDDSVPWCSAFVNYIAWLLRLPRSKSLAARSWLLVGQGVDVRDAKVGFDVVVIKRGAVDFGPETIAAPGHVGLFAGWSGENDVLILGGNQSDSVSVEAFPKSKILGIRRLAS